jgi:hypothetical protein
MPIRIPNEVSINGNMRPLNLAPFLTILNRDTVYGALASEGIERRRAGREWHMVIASGNGKARHGQVA